MSKQSARILEEALNLEVDERAKLAVDLIASVDGQVDDDADSAWASEIEQRAHRARESHSQGVPWNRVRAQLASKLSD